jgi:flavin reductase (DIM6/NTAB) family NADH-FMN oxidoreductase RutF
MDGGMMDQTAMIPDAGNARAFRDALGAFATGVCVVTTEGPAGPMGFTANSFASLSLDPPLVLWSPARASMRFPVFAAAAEFAIHVLAEDQGDLMRRFVRGGAGFDGIEADRSPEGVPVLQGTLARFDCARHATHDGGDHLIIVGLVRRFAQGRGAPLVFSAGRYGRFDPA